MRLLTALAAAGLLLVTAGASAQNSPPASAVTPSPKAYGPMMGYGMGPGMMGGYGMGPGMMGGYGMGPGMMMGGYGMGPGMMRGPGMMMGGYGMGPGMMRAPGMMYGPGMGGYGAQPGGDLALSVADVKSYFERWLVIQNNPNLKLGPVLAKDANSITADIVTTDKGGLVQRFAIDRHSGLMGPER